MTTLELFKRFALDVRGAKTKLK